MTLQSTIIHVWLYQLGFCLIVLFTYLPKLQVYNHSSALPGRPWQLDDRMSWNQFDIIVVERSMFELEVETVTQLVVGVQVLVTVLGERDAVNLADRCAHVAAR